MKLVYTHENRLLVGNAKNILEAEGIELVLKNEFASGAMAEISLFDAWLELWVLEDSDYDKAILVIENSLSKENAIDWKCTQCSEKNDVSFALCWHCGTEGPN